MARATFIWLVQDTQGDVIAAFTVKHELSKWLEAHGINFLVSRIKDGLHSRAEQAVQLNPRTLEKAL
ncbi:MAG: hypothetical protein ABW022_07200 [Actinoplanes sp.]